MLLQQSPVVLYDIREVVGVETGSIAVGLTFVAVGLLSLWYAGGQRRLATRRDDPELGRSATRNRSKAFTAITLGLLAATVPSLMLVRGTRDLQRRLSVGDVEMMEGTIRKFRNDLPSDGQSWEVFDGTRTRHFEYRRGVATAGFRGTADTGGEPLRNGRRVRVFDVGGTIVRLELLEAATER